MHHRVYVGQVVSDKMEKTVVVAVPWVQRHRRYGKAIRRVTKLYAHDPRGECQMGDRVRVVEVRPLSRTKRWLVKNILHRRDIVQAPELEEAVGAVVAPAATAEELRSTKRRRRSRRSLSPRRRQTPKPRSRMRRRRRRRPKRRRSLRPTKQSRRSWPKRTKQSQRLRRPRPRNRQRRKPRTTLPQPKKHVGSRGGRGAGVGSRRGA